MAGLTERFYAWMTILNMVSLSKQTVHGLGVPQRVDCLKLEDQPGEKMAQRFSCTPGR